jgi:diguanylate cyclase (GGDEF)-like protein
MSRNRVPIDRRVPNTISTPTPIRPVLSISHSTRPPSVGLEANLSSALRATDAEFGNILREVDEIASLLESKGPDLQALTAAAPPEVWSAVKEVLLERELRHLALTDDLTCLYNRRGFFAAATQLLRIAARNSESHLLLFCDVDNLKQINDTFGHREGDLALLHTAEALECTFRSADVLARMGGDEFVVLAQQTSSQSQEVLLQRFKDALKRVQAENAGYQLSVSVGVAHFDPHQPLSLGELIERADKAMYGEKRNRRNSSLSLPTPLSGFAIVGKK